MGRDYRETSRPRVDRGLPRTMKGWMQGWDETMRLGWARMGEKLIAMRCAPVDEDKRMNRQRDRQRDRQTYTLSYTQ